MELNARQLCLIAGGLFPLTKLILLPSSLAYYAGKDLFLPALILLLLEGGVLFSVLQLSSKTDKTFFELLSDTFGRLTARIVFGVYGAYFLFSALLPVYEQTLLLRTAFYDTIPSPLFFAAFYIVCIYLCLKPFKSFGRCADFLVPVSSVALLLLLALSVSDAKFSSLLPLFQTSAKTIALTAARSVPRFLDCAFPLFFLGHFRHEKNTTLKVMLSFLAGALFLLLFLCTFYAVYGVIAPARSSAISKIGRYFPGVDVIGRIDLLLIYLLSGSYLLYLMLPFRLSVHCLKTCFQTKDEYDVFYAVGINLIAFVLYFFLNYTVVHFEQFVSGFYLLPIFVLFSYFIPVLARTLRRSHA